MYLLLVRTTTLCVRPCFGDAVSRRQRFCGLFLGCSMLMRHFVVFAKEIYWLKARVPPGPVPQTKAPESSRNIESQKGIPNICTCVVEKACSYYVVRSKLIFIGNILTKRPVWRSHFHYGSSRTSWVELDQQKNVWENIRVALAKTQARMGWCVVRGGVDRTLIVSLLLILELALDICGNFPVVLMLP